MAVETTATAYSIETYELIKVSPYKKLAKLMGRSGEEIETFIINAIGWCK